MEQQRNEHNEVNDLDEQRPEGGKNKGVPEHQGTHDEGQYQEGNDKATMSPGSSDAEVNPSAKNHNKDND